jgi:hypothetical protein
MAETRRIFFTPLIKLERKCQRRSHFRSLYDATSPTVVLPSLEYRTPSSDSIVLSSSTS